MKGHGIAPCVQELCTTQVWAGRYPTTTFAPQMCGHECLAAREEWC
jgi:hypothetical protein